MSLELIVMPLLTLIAGVLSLFTDPKSEKARWRKPTMLSLLMLTSLLTIFFGYQNARSSQIEKAANVAQIHSLEGKVSELLKKNSELNSEILTLQEGIDSTPERTSQIILTALIGQGWKRERLRNVDLIQIDQSLAAGQLVEAVAADPQRQSITVQYFPKDVDPEIVRVRLQDLGFTLTTPRSDLNEIPTNAIWYGEEVDIESVKAIAYTLIGAGVDIKMIRQLNNSQGREQVIQVGGDGECLNQPALTLEAIEAAQRFPHQRDVENCQI
jgi:hypothetical protein